MTRPLLLRAGTNVVNDLMEDIITDEVVQRFLDAPPDYVVCDELAWLDDILNMAGDRLLDSREIFSDRFVGRYSAVRSYHACCPADLGSYCLNGLVVLDTAMANDIARRKEGICTGIGRLRRLGQTSNSRAEYHAS